MLLLSAAVNTSETTPINDIKQNLQTQCDQEEHNQPRTIPFGGMNKKWEKDRFQIFWREALETSGGDDTWFG